MNIIIEQPEKNSLEKVNKLLAGIPRGAVTATSSALKRAGQNAMTNAGRFAAAEYAITKRDFMKNVRSKSSVKVEAGGVTELHISFAGNVLPLLTFQTRYSRSGKLTTQVKRNGGAATLQNAFVTQMGGHTGVYERVGDKRFPVEQKYGPSTSHMMENPEVVKKMQQSVLDTYEKRIDHEILRVLNGWGMR